MTTFASLPAFRALILGATTATGLFGLAAQSHAMMTADEFLASLDDMKRVCRRLDESFFIKQHNYGCGNYVCHSRVCHYVKRKPPRRPPVVGIVPVDPVVDIAPEKKSDGHETDNSDRGRDNGPNGPTGSVAHE